MHNGPGAVAQSPPAAWGHLAAALVAGLAGGGGLTSLSAATLVPGSPAEQFSSRVTEELFSSGNNTRFVLELFMHCSDMSNAAKPPTVCRAWAKRVVERGTAPLALATLVLIFASPLFKLFLRRPLLFLTVGYVGLLASRDGAMSFPPAGSFITSKYSTLCF